MRKILFLLCAILGLVFTSCSKDKDDEEPTTTSINLEDNIVGTWLMTDNGGWTTYEFTATARVNVVSYASNVTTTGNGYYWINDNELSGSYSTETGATTYIDWVGKSISAFEFNFGLYNDNTYLGEATLYKVLQTVEMERKAQTTPDYKGITGLSSSMTFTSLDKSVVSVNASSGELTANAQGSTYLLVSTEKGTFALAVNVVAPQKTLDELILGTWIYDNVDEKEWQRTKFVEGGLLYCDWIATTNGYSLNETSNGTYSVNGEKVTFSVKTSAGLRINQVWEITKSSYFEIEYNATSDGQSNGKYYGRRLLESDTIVVGESVIPDYVTLTDGYPVLSYNSHKASIATVDNSGAVVGIATGRTYIDIETSDGTAVVEIVVVKPEVADLWSDYTKAFGKTVAEIKEEYGSPFYESGTTCYFAQNNEYVSYVAFLFSSTTGKAYAASVILQDNADKQSVFDYLSNKYYYYEKGSDAASKYYAFTDKEVKDESAIGITFDWANGLVTYVDLTAER